MIHKSQKDYYFKYYMHRPEALKFVATFLDYVKSPQSKKKLRIYSGLVKLVTINLHSKHTRVYNLTNLNQNVKCLSNDESTSEKTSEKHNLFTQAVL